MIHRILQEEILRLSKIFPVVTITGPRQSGKTTLCRETFPDYEYINLENLDLREKVAADTLNLLRHYGSGLIIDEAQHLPELFSYVQIAADEDRSRHYILTGSSNFALLEKVTQSLVGRTAVLTLLPLSIGELSERGTISTDTLLLRGGFPAVWAHQLPPKDVYSAYYTTYVERDLRQIVNIRNLSLFGQFVRLSAGRCACEFIPSDFANELGVDMKTIQHWNSILETSYITFLLPPYYRNVGKRIVKTPKRYFYDTGLLCFLLGIENEQQLATHPLRGAIFENYVVAEMMKQYYHKEKFPTFTFIVTNRKMRLISLRKLRSTIFKYMKSSRRIPATPPFSKEWTISESCTAIKWMDRVYYTMVMSGRILHIMVFATFAKSRINSIQLLEPYPQFCFQIFLQPFDTIDGKSSESVFSMNSSWTIIIVFQANIHIDGVPNRK